MGKKILITGAGTGLGLGTAIGLAKNGHAVIAAVHIWPQATSVRAAAAAAGVDVAVIKLDVTDPADRAHALKHDIDVLVNKAGTGATGPVAEIPVGFMREVMETNVWGPLELTQAFAARFAQRGHGKIVFVSSVAGLVTLPFLAPYNASKFALEAVAQCMQHELEDYGVRVCTINPGPYRTGFNDRLYDQVDQWYAPDTHFTREGPIREQQAWLADNQIDPQEMIDKMVAVIPSDAKHPFRIVFPDDFVGFCEDYQARMWTAKI
ncbi:MAG: SDR family oxidoreductase [Acidobacteriota bacterium]